MIDAWMIRLEGCGGPDPMWVELDTEQGRAKHMVRLTAVDRQAMRFAREQDAWRFIAFLKAMRAHVAVDLAGRLVPEHHLWATAAKGAK